MTMKIPIKDKILLAALDEFGSRGYDLSSTNVIAQKANVSKGSIFKYYKSKSLLFYELFNNEINKFIMAYRDMLPTFSNDVLEKLIEIILWKSFYSQTHPESAKVLLEGIANPPKEIKSQIANSMIMLQELSIESIFSQINKDNLRDDITEATFNRTLNIALSGLQATYINKKTTFDSLFSIKDEAMEFLKIIIRGMEK